MLKKKKIKFRLVSAKEDPEGFENFLIELVKSIKFPENHTKTVLTNNDKKKKLKCC